MSRIAALFLVSFIFLVGCGEDEPPAPQHSNHPPGSGNNGGNSNNSGSQEWVLNPETAGTIGGSVKLVGKPPKRRIVDMGSHSHCQKSDEPVYSETVVVGPNGELKNCFVYVKKGLENYRFSVPSDPVLLDQNGCMYNPHVMGIMAYQVLRIRNSDSTAHNIHALPKRNSEWNFSQNSQGMTTDKVFTFPEVMVFIKCDLHGWMGCYVGVLPHPFYAVTDDGGRFTLPPLNPGHYELEIWHERYGTQSVHVQLDAKGQISLNLSYSTGTGN